MSDYVMSVMTECPHEMSGMCTWPDCLGGSIRNLTREGAIPIIAKAIWANDEDWAENGPYQIPIEDAKRVVDALLAGGSE